MKKDMILLSIAILLLIMLFSMINRFNYNLSISNRTSFGIEILSISHLSIPLPIKLSPGPPGDIIALNPFNNDPKSLPKEPIEIVWQLNQLKNCKVNEKIRIIDRNDPYWKSKDRSQDSRGKDDIRIYPSYLGKYKHLGLYARKEGCIWKPLPNKTFRQTIDIAALKKTKEAKLASGMFNFRIFGPYSKKYTMNIELVFTGSGENIDIETQAVKTTSYH